jgi:hypothetical protein
MNFTVISILLALGHPIIHSAYRNYLHNKKTEALKDASFTLVHSIKGRRRYKSILLKDESFGHSLKKKMEKLKIFKTVSINSKTGTMLLTYDSDEHLMDELFATLNEESRKVTERKIQDEAQAHTLKQHANSMFSSNLDKAALGTISAISTYGIGQGVKQLGKKSILGSTINRYTHNLNEAVHNATGGVTDIGTAVGLVSLVWGIYQIFVNNQKPSGPQLLWWGYKLLDGHN